MAPRRNQARQQPGSLQSRQRAKLRSQGAQKSPLTAPPSRTGPRRQISGSTQGGSRIGTPGPERPALPPKGNGAVVRRPTGTPTSNGGPIQRVRVREVKPELPGRSGQGSLPGGSRGGAVVRSGGTPKLPAGAGAAARSAMGTVGKGLNAALSVPAIIDQVRTSVERTRTENQARDQYRQREALKQTANSGRYVSGDQQVKFKKPKPPTPRSPGSSGSSGTTRSGTPSPAPTRARVTSPAPTRTAPTPPKPQASNRLSAAEQAQADADSKQYSRQQSDNPSGGTPTSKPTSPVPQRPTRRPTGRDEMIAENIRRARRK